jgi:hypothetical protein
MDKSLDFYIKNLPTEIGKEIFSFIIPISSNIIFYDYHEYLKNIHTYIDGIPLSYYTSYDYGRKYEIAYICNTILQNQNGLYLSRISKKNGKYRYYITEEILDSRDEEDSDNIIREVLYYRYESKYIGKNIDYSLLLFN